jgi:hypothetical protein
MRMGVPQGGWGIAPKVPRHQWSPDPDRHKACPYNGEGKGEGEAFHAHGHATGAWGIASDQQERGNTTVPVVRDCFGRYAPSQ